MFCSLVVALEGVLFVAEGNGLLDGWGICSVRGDGRLLQCRSTVRRRICHSALLLEERRSCAGECVSKSRAVGGGLVVRMRERAI